MRRNLTLVLLLAAAAALPARAPAQAPDSLLAVSYQGQSRFRVNIDGGSVWTGTFDEDIGGAGIPVDGSGTRMLWYPRKGAFRAGGIGGTQWDAANIGNHSVAMGLDVRASGNYAVALGLRSTAAMTSSFAVGEDNTATGFASVAMGYHAHTNAKRGSFVFGDNVTNGTQDTIRADLPGQAVWRLSCGMRIYTNQAKTSGVSFGGPSVNPSVCGSGGAYHDQATAMISTSTGAYLGTDGVWRDVSDVNRKHLFADVSGQDVLTRLRALPITTWSYKVDAPGVRHLGPTAQDFHAAFGLGSDPTTIAGVDEGGVALAAIQELDRITGSQDARIQALESANAKLQRENAELRARLERIEAMLSKPAASPTP